MLWEEYRRRKNTNALESLLAYNVQDTLSLHLLMVHAHNQKSIQTPFGVNQQLPLPKLPKIEYDVDRELVNRLLRQAFRFG
jgi:hypothetical protein